MIDLSKLTRAELVELRGEIEDILYPVKQAAGPEWKPVTPDMIAQALKVPSYD